MPYAEDQSQPRDRAGGGWQQGDGRLILGEDTATRDPVACSSMLGLVCSASQTSRVRLLELAFFG